MKNLIVAINCKEDRDDLISHLNCQLDNSSHFKWKREDVIVVTDFNFKYKDFKSIEVDGTLYHNNPTFNKWIFLKNNPYILDDDFWVHSYDVWQTFKIYMPEFPGEIGACPYVFNGELNFSSIFIKKSSLFLIEYIVDFIEKNDKSVQTSTDEDWISFLRTNIKEIAGLISTVDSRYNVGSTKIEYRYKNSKEPICAISLSFKNKSIYEIFKGNNNCKGSTEGVNLVPDYLDKLFLKHNLLKWI